MVLSEEKRKEVYQQRKRIQADNLEILEDIYRTNPRPSKLFRNTVAKELGLPNK